MRSKKPCSLDQSHRWISNNLRLVENLGKNYGYEPTKFHSAFEKVYDLVKPSKIYIVMLSVMAMFGLTNKRPISQSQVFACGLSDNPICFFDLGYFASIVFTRIPDFSQ